MSDPRFELFPIGRVRSPLTEPAEAPRQPDEGAPPAWLEMDPAIRAGWQDLTVGQSLLVLTWLHRARRDVLVVHPRGDLQRPVSGVFSTRSSERPNPIGLHLVRVVEVEGDRITVDRLEALDGTPVIDLKPVLGTPETR